MSTDSATLEQPISFMSVMPSGSVNAVTIRALIQQFASEGDVLAKWKGNLNEWIDNIASFREAETEIFIKPDEVSELRKRVHRLILHSLIAGGEALAVELIQSEAEEQEKQKQLEYVDAFLDNLKMTLIAFHRSKKPDKRFESLAKFLG